MRYVKLSDGTTIRDCSDATTCFEIFAIRDTAADAASVSEVITNDNCRNIKVFDQDSETLISSATNLKRDPGCRVEELGDKYVCWIMLSSMSRLDIVEEEIAELQEAIIGG